MAGFALAVALGPRHRSRLLLALAFALTTFQTLFDNAATALLPALVPRAALGQRERPADDRPADRGRLSGRARWCRCCWSLGAAVPFAADAASYLPGRRAADRLPARPTAPERAPRPAGQHPASARWRTGLRTLWRDRAAARAVHRHRPVQHRHGRADRHPRRSMSPPGWTRATAGTRRCMTAVQRSAAWPADCWHRRLVGPDRADTQRGRSPGPCRPCALVAMGPCASRGRWRSRHGGLRAS